MWKGEFTHEHKRFGPLDQFGIRRNRSKFDHQVSWYSSAYSHLISNTRLCLKPKTKRGKNVAEAFTEVFNLRRGNFRKGKKNTCWNFLALEKKHVCHNCCRWFPFFFVSRDWNLIQRKRGTILNRKYKFSTRQLRGKTISAGYKTCHQRLSLTIIKQLNLADYQFTFAACPISVESKPLVTIAHIRTR